MNGIHDLGGTDGLGSVLIEQDEPVWHAEWEKVAFTLFFVGFRNGYFNLDEFRSGIEQMAPADYLSSTYYEHWLHTIEAHGVEAGAIDVDELDRLTQHFLEHPDAPLPESSDPGIAAAFEAVVRSGGSAKRPNDAPARFAAGDVVRVADDHPLGHTRRARYIRGRQGVITRVHDAFIYPDSAANGGGEDPQRVYTVRFRSVDLWGEATGDPKAAVYFDVWEPYLTPAAN